MSAIDPEFLTIDTNRLDTELAKQPKLYFDIAEKSIDAKQVRDESKNHVELVRAKLDKLIRANPDKYGIDKITISSIDAVTKTHPKFAAAMGDLSTAQYDYDILQNALVALDHKKRSLQGLVSLHGQNYFSSVPVEKEAQESITEVIKKSARKALKRRRTRSSE